MQIAEVTKAARAVARAEKKLEKVQVQSTARNEKARRELNDAILVLQSVTPQLTLHDQHVSADEPALASV